MTWVRYTEEPEQGHECQPPMRERVSKLPASLTGPGTTELEHRFKVPDGAEGDLWRCDHCGLLWRHDYFEVVWVPAGWWLRLWNYRRGRDTRVEDPAVTARLEAEKERP